MSHYKVGVSRYVQAILKMKKHCSNTLRTIVIAHLYILYKVEVHCGSKLKTCKMHHVFAVNCLISCKKMHAVEQILMNCF